MEIKPFKLERYFAKYEFSTKYLFSSSDCDGLSMSQLVENSDDETKRLWENLNLGYTESQGHPLLREEIAGLYKTVQPNNVLIAAPEEAIFIAMNALLSRGDHIVCTHPGYQSLYQIAEHIGCNVSKWEPEEENGWHFSPRGLEEQVKKNTLS